jgi:hypothetical protein
MSLSDEEENELNYSDDDMDEYKRRAYEYDPVKPRYNIERDTMNPLYYFLLLVPLLIHVIMCVAFMHGAFDPLSKSTVICKIIDKKSIPMTDGSQSYLIYTDQETLQDSDNIFIGKSDAPRIFNEMQVGHMYKMSLIGWESEVSKKYPNIIQFEEVKT